ncbi:MAG: YgjV family protein [Oscillospiraceae bacterium]|nr:YgjV family protein [Oscillospiraceae bacterium]
MLGQAVSILGMLLTIISFQMKTRKQIIAFQTAGSFLFLVSYILLRSWPAVYLNVVFLIRNTVFYFGRDQKWSKHKAWLPVLLCAVVAAGSIGFRSWLDLLPIIGSVFGTVAMYMKSENMLRLLKLGDSPCWLIYNCTVPSLGGVLCEVFNITSIVIGLIRYKQNGILPEKAKGGNGCD